MPDSGRAAENGSEQAIKTNYMATFHFSTVRFISPGRLGIRGAFRGLRVADEQRFYVVSYILRPFEGARVSKLDTGLPPLFVTVGREPETAVAHNADIPRKGNRDRVAMIQAQVRSGTVTKVELSATIYDSGFLREGVTVVKDITRLFL